MSYGECQEKLSRAKADLQNAGCIHRRDLLEHIRRLEIELKRRRHDKTTITPSPSR